jgi:signal transduction histidine kinase
MRGSLRNARDHISKTIALCERTDEKHYLMATKAGQCLVHYLQTGVVDGKIVLEINAMLKETRSFLSHSHVAMIFLQTDILQGNYEKAYQSQKHLLRSILSKCLNSEYTVPAFALTSELFMLELRGRKNGKSCLTINGRRITMEFMVNMSLLWFSCISYPAYRGSYYRSKAWWYALKGSNNRARRYFLKAIKAHHSLDMRYEEARSLRDYGDFLQESLSLPGEAKDKYGHAYELFEWCGAKLETDRLKDKIDFAVFQRVETRHPEPIEKNTQLASSHTTTAGVNQVRVNTLYELSNSIRNIDDIDELLHCILRSMINATGAQFGGLFVTDDQQAGRQCLFMNFEGATIPEAGIRYSTKIVEKVMNGREVILVKDAVRERDFAGDCGGEVRSALCVPLTRGKSFHGCVYLGNNMVTGLFSEDSKKTALIIASEAGILLENAYLMDSYKRLNRDLQKKVREQTTDIREKNKQLEEYTLRITDSERMKGLLGGTIVHDIKNYAAGIEGNIALLSRQFSEEQKVQKTSRIVTDCCSSIVSLASNMLDITKMEEGKLVLKKETLTKNALFDMASQLSGNTMLEEKGIKVSFQDNTRDLFAIDADYYLIERVMQNLFSNAAKYAPRNGTVVMSLDEKGEENILGFFSSGVPIPDEDKTLLFDKYARIESASSQYSKGLGLFFCKMVMNAHRGRIWLETDERGNCFRLAFRKKFVQSIFSPAA